MPSFPVLSSKNPERSRKSSAGGRAFFHLARVAKAALGYTIFVVLFGAVVRITGSGAGCGQHWPSCNGDIVHLPRRFETFIELTHRLTSAGALVAVLALAVVAVLEAPRGHRLRSAAFAAVGLTLVEALIGAALVLYRLVAHDTSTARAFVMPAHLVSVYALVATLTLAALWSAPPRTRHETAPAGGHALTWLCLGALAIVVVAATGALTALGDTLFPPAAHSLASRLAEDQGQTAHGLQRLRVIHPLLAALAAVGVAGLALRFGDAHPSAAHALLALTGVQVTAGIVNVLLSAPGWMQIVHLALSLALWIALVTLIGATRDASSPAAAP